MGTASRGLKKLPDHAERPPRRHPEGQAGRDLVSGRGPHRPEERLVRHWAGRTRPAPARRPSATKALLES
jgi:hypothetical protein